MVLDPDTDCKDYININNPRAREQVLNLMIAGMYFNRFLERT